MKPPNIAILDYGIGNVKSIYNALEKVGATSLLTNEPDQVLAADGLILPGVGAFKAGMDNLKSKNLIPVIEKFIESGKPFLGICLGMQLLMEESDEFGNTKGLGIISGRVQKIEIKENSSLRLPHVSWNRLREPSLKRWINTPLQNIPQDSDFYFVHSFAARPSDPKNILAFCNYGDVTFCAAVQKNNVYGLQFHPEKSGKAGLQILEQFIKITKTN